MSASGAVEGERARGCANFGCLVRAPLGCLSFCFGAMVVFVFLLPAAFGRLVGPSWEKSFDTERMGSLAFGEFRLAWFGAQTIEGITLKEPTGATVASVELALPPLIEVLEGLDRGSLGPIGVDLHADLEVDGAGRWNLGRALERRPRLEGEPFRSSSQGSLDLDTDLIFSLLRGTVTWSRVGRGQERILHLNAGLLRIVASGAHTLEVTGTLDGGGDLALEGTFTDLGGLLAHEPRSLDWSLTGTGVPASAMEDVLGLPLPIPDALGERVALLELEVEHDEPDTRLRARAEGSRAQVRLEGWLQDGALVSGDARDREPGWELGDDALPAPGEAGEAPEVPGAPETPELPELPGPGGPGSVEFALGGLWSELVEGLLPIVEVRGSGIADLGRIRLASFHLPLDGDMTRLDARLSLELDSGSLAILPDTLVALDPAWGEATLDGPLLLTITDGQVRYGSAALGVGGERVELSGTLDLVQRRIDARLRGPAALFDPDAGDVRGALAIRGDLDDPVVEAVAAD